MLQSGAQELEYEDLLQKAVEATDPVLRMCYVAAFAISGYAHTKLRTGRKNLYVSYTEGEWTNVDHVWRIALPCLGRHSKT